MEDSYFFGWTDRPEGPPYFLNQRYICTYGVPAQLLVEKPFHFRFLHMPGIFGIIFSPKPNLRWHDVDA